jgi:hypothetical protein
LASWGNIGELRFLSIGDAALLLAAGLTVGALSGFVAARTIR